GDWSSDVCSSDLRRWPPSVPAWLLPAPTYRTGAGSCSRSAVRLLPVYLRTTTRWRETLATGWGNLRHAMAVRVEDIGKHRKQRRVTPDGHVFSKGLPVPC